MGLFEFIDSDLLIAGRLAVFGGVIRTLENNEFFTSWHLKSLILLQTVFALKSFEVILRVSILSFVIFLFSLSTSLPSIRTSWAGNGSIRHRS